MFERRLKIFFGILVAAVAVMLIRCAHIQIVQADDWRKKAEDSLKRDELLSTVRGRILDRKGRVLAYDEPCIEAAVDYRAIERDDTWMKDQAIVRIKAKAGEEYRRAGSERRKSMVAAELAQVNRDLDEMWHVLAEEGGKSMDQIEEIRSTIRQRVEMRQRSVWYQKYEKAIERHQGEGDEPWYKEWLLGSDSAPQIDSFRIPVAEESQPHVIIPSLPNEKVIRLKKLTDKFPGLVLRPSKHRVYPYGSVACHVIGTLSPVVREDLKSDPNLGHELRQYYPSDQIGRGGIEAYCEQLLRGSRGMIEHAAGSDQPLSRTEPTPGKDVTLSVDIDLQAEIENAFKEVTWYGKDGQVTEKHEMHGAAVVIDIASGDILALVSNPTFDLNTYQDDYLKLVRDEFNAPLLNRATQAPHEPGSTVKPIIGVGAITQGLFGINDTVQCTGVLIIDGKPQIGGRCWTFQRYASLLGKHATHQYVPPEDPHPTGYLTFADAIQRSCNVFFETLGNLLGPAGEQRWFQQFGLGEKVGIGIPEFAGHIPRPIPGLPRSAAWFSAIGQSQVLATPLQMANVAATIARDGIWVRPHLVSGDSRPPTTRPTVDRRDLHLMPEALAVAKEGMYRVVNTYAGSAYILHRCYPGLSICGKTGTAQASKFGRLLRGPDGQPLRDEKGNFRHEFFPIGDPHMGPWYRGSGLSGKDLSHAWFICFAPREHPQIAFAVMLEYGGSGGGDAAPISKAVLDACIKHGYLRAHDADVSQTAQR